MIEKLEATKHPYYCNDGNYRVNDALVEYECWEDFIAGWGDADLDYNMIFRFDINPQRDEDTDEETGKFNLHLYYMLQRKGNFIPVIIENIEEEELAEINKFLEIRWNYMKRLWSEFSK